MHRFDKSQRFLLNYVDTSIRTLNYTFSLGRRSNENCYAGKEGVNASILHLFYKKPIITQINYMLEKQYYVIYLKYNMYKNVLNAKC